MQSCAKLVLHGLGHIQVDSDSYRAGRHKVQQGREWSYQNHAKLSYIQKRVHTGLVKTLLSSEKLWVGLDQSI